MRISASVSIGEPIPPPSDYVSSILLRITPLPVENVRHLLRLSGLGELPESMGWRSSLVLCVTDACGLFSLCRHRPSSFPGSVRAYPFRGLGGCLLQDEHLENGRITWFALGTSIVVSNDGMYAVKGLTPGVTSFEATLRSLQRWGPQVSLNIEPMRVWFVDASKSGLTVETVRLDTLWLVFWEDVLAAVEGDFPRRNRRGMRAAFSRRLGAGGSPWSNGLSSALVELDETGRCYFQIAHKALFEQYNQEVSRRLEEERSRQRTRLP